MNLASPAPASPARTEAGSPGRHVDQHEVQNHDPEHDQNRLEEALKQEIERFQKFSPTAAWRETGRHLNAGPIPCGGYLEIQTSSMDLLRPMPVLTRFFTFLRLMVTFCIS